ncbi:MAG TPA: GNAT family N-acetyltransferase [Myxococcales bacterium]|jgi:long-subunit acyl-CoA synthetase (AMP-forming)/GNAT superfamily N-acetyltransferase
MRLESLGLPPLERWPGWERSGEVPRLLAAVEAAFGVVRPADLEAVRPAVEQLVARAVDPEVGPAVRRVLAALVDAARGRPFLSGLTADRVQGWLDLVLPAMGEADYTVATLLRSRAREEEAGGPALRVLSPEPAELDASQLLRRARELAAGFVALTGDDPDARVAFLSENRLETALCDLACLAHGIVDVPVPANAANDQVQYVLRHSKARVVVVSDEVQLSRVLAAQPGLPDLLAIVPLSRGLAERHALTSLDEMVERGARIPRARLDLRAAAVRSADLATVMYTSGTTGTPKGIAFTQHNLVAKRLCRSFALPFLGEGDVFLSYLPLFHTFGRWLELLGTLWTGAQYVFARSPALTTLLEDFASVRPTVFISVPQKWLELHERAAQEAGGDEDPDRVAEKLRELTGGRLRFGLSAAGFLEPRVFRAFQRAGVQLCSGYGMTEATGGVTMTPPTEYVEGSIGKALPGIELRVAEDGELSLRGPYVMRGYDRPPDGETGLDGEGWFKTGDLVAVDAGGHYRLTGRKKEIYKSLKGQTIAPQRVENLFRDFDAVSQAFLVGDGREFNTLLVWPNFAGQPALAHKEPETLRALLSSLVASANRFLAPYERVVDFAVLDRALDEAHGELTPKGSFRREAVEAHWQHLIAPMYRGAEARLAVGSLELVIPHWLLRELGALREDVSLTDGWLEARGRKLRVVEGDPGGAAQGSIHVGDLGYRPRAGALDLGAVAGTPALALGNDGLRTFLGEATFFSLLGKRRGGGQGVQVEARGALAPSRRRVQELLPLVEAPEVTVESLHAAAVLARARLLAARVALQHLELGLSRGGEAAAVARALLRRCACFETRLRRRALRMLLPHEEASRVVETLGAFTEAPPGAELLGPRDHVRLAERGLGDAQVEALLAEVREHARSPNRAADSARRRRLVAIFRLLSAYTVAHPRWYPRLRIKLARLALHADAEVAARAGEELDRLQLGFRAWLGPNQRLAVDPDSGREYGWREAAIFAPEVSAPHRTLLQRALAETCLVREAAFLFGRGTLLSLADLPPAGVGVSPLDRDHGEASYLVTLTPRAGEPLAFHVHVAESVPVLELREEIRWLLWAGAPPPLVGAFGGSFPEYGIYSTEPVPGESVEAQLTRLSAMQAHERMRALWPFLASTAFGVHVGFWERSGEELALRGPSPGNVIAPSHDYQVGTRLGSLWDRERCEGLSPLVLGFERSFVEPLEARHPVLAGGAGREQLLSALVETLGEARAQPLLEQAARQGGPLAADAQAFLARLAREGLTPLEVSCASRRYARWLAVNPEATLEARAAMLGELWDTYRLSELEAERPETRIRFFRQTVFAQARPALSEGLDELMRRARARRGAPSELPELVEALRVGARPTTFEEDWLLARLAFRHLPPSADTALISLPHAGRTTAEVVVHLSRGDGGRFSVRSPVSAREVARLLQLFHEASLPVSFSAEHEFLVAVDERGALLGGVFYRLVGTDRARMEKIGVARAWRRQGISDGLMHELFRRLRERGVRQLETGFFHPDYLKRFGFRVAPSSGGLFQDLQRGEVRLD